MCYYFPSVRMWLECDYGEDVDDDDDENVTLSSFNIPIPPLIFMEEGALSSFKF